MRMKTAIEIESQLLGRSEAMANSIEDNEANGSEAGYETGNLNFVKYLLNQIGSIERG